jgi:tellurite resistance protein
MTSLFQFTPSESLAVLRALKTVAMADGKFAVKEAAMLVSSAELLGLPADTADTAEPITPEGLAAEVPDPQRRTLALKACLVMGIVDGQISPEEWKILSAFRGGLGIDEAELQTFHGLVNDHRQLTRFQYERHLAAPRRGTLYASEGWQGVLQFFAEDLPFAHLTAARENAELAHRYRQIGNLPDGTLGHALYRHYREREFAFAGEPGGVPEALVHHDIIHILSGYDTDFDGELQTLAFTAGMRREDPFSALFLVLLQFTAGYKVTPTGALASPRTLFDQERILKALQRGRKTVIDFSAKKEFWDVMDQTIASLREHYGVPPLSSGQSGAMPAAKPAS